MQKFRKNYKSLCFYNSFAIKSFWSSEFCFRFRIDVFWCMKRTVDTKKKEINLSFVVAAVMIYVFNDCIPFAVCEYYNIGARFRRFLKKKLIPRTFFVWHLFSNLTFRKPTIRSKRKKRKRKRTKATKAGCIRSLF